MLKEISIFPELNTERLLLRQPAEKDATELWTLRSDASVNKYLNRQPTATPEDALKFIEKVNAGFDSQSAFYWVIIKKETDKLIGTICLYSFSSEHSNCEIGYEMLPEYQGLGFMQESMQEVIKFCFQTIDIHSLNACTHKNNLRSTQLLQKFGFVNAGVTDDDPDLILFRLFGND